VWLEKKYDKGKNKLERAVQKAEKGMKSLLDGDKPESEGEGQKGPQDAGGSAGLGLSDNADVMGDFPREGAAAGQLGAFDSLASGAEDAMTPSAKEIPAELETGQPSLPQLSSASALFTKDELSLSPETAIASTVPKPILEENEVTGALSIEDSLAAIGAGSGTVRLGDNSFPAVEVTETELDTAGGVSQAHAVEALPPSTLTDHYRELETMTSSQRQATPISVATDEDEKPLEKSGIISTVSAPNLTEKKGGACDTKQGIESPPAPAPAHSAARESTAAASSTHVGALIKGTLKAALGIVVTLVPEPFKGAAEVLQKVVGVIEVCVHSISLLYMFLSD
jgi:hypothetical protein